MNWLSWIVLLIVLSPVIIMLFRMLATILAPICAIIGIILILTGSFWTGVATLVVAIIAGAIGLEYDPDKNVWWF